MKTFTVVSVCLGSVVASDEMDSMGLIQHRKSKLHFESQECKVEVFQHGDFSGWKAQFGIGTYTFQQFLAAGARNDEVSAIKVYGDGCEATVFEHEFTGWSATFGQGTYDYGAFVAKGAKNDHASSIIVANPKAAAAKKAADAAAAAKKAADEAAAAKRVADEAAAAKKAADNAAAKAAAEKKAADDAAAKKAADEAAAKKAADDAAAAKKVKDDAAAAKKAADDAAAKAAAEKKAADEAAAAKKAAEEAVAKAYVSKQKGVISYGGEKWLESSIVKGSGVMACYRTVMEDPQCVKDYFSYVDRGDKNCGCHKVSGFGIRNDDNSDIYQITAAAAAALSGVVRLPLNSNDCPYDSKRITDLSDCKEVLSRLVYPYNDYYQNNPHQDRPTGCIWHSNGNGYFNPSGKVKFSDQAPICRKR